MKKNVTFGDIARYTNFSKTTISRYFNHPDSLTEENKAIIRQALSDLGYHENKIARVLANGETEFVGLMIPNLFLSYFSEMLVQILSSYEQFGYKFIVFVGNGNKDMEEKYLEELMAYQIEGLIVLSHAIPSSELAALPVPVVAIEREDEFISSVNCDNYMGAIQACSLLIRRQCEVLIHINLMVSENVPARQRIQGFRDFCSEHQIENQVYIREMGDSSAVSRPVLSEILAEIEQRYPGRRKGLFVSNDNNANELLNLLFRKYSCLPEDYRIVGFDNAPVSRESILTISTVGQQIDVIAHEAVRLLDKEIRNRKKNKTGARKAPVHKVITPVLYLRETTEGTV